MINAPIIEDSELSTVSGGSSIVSSGNAAYISGTAPKWNVGDVLRVNYCEADGRNCRAKCLVRSISSTRNAGPSGAEFAYTVQILWLPASCSAANTDIGKTYILCESCLSQD